MTENETRSLLFVHACGYACRDTAADDVNDSGRCPACNGYASRENFELVRYTSREYFTNVDEHGQILDSERPMRCDDCGRPSYYDSNDESYHHAINAEHACFLIASENRADDTQHPLFARYAPNPIGSYDALIRSVVSHVDEWHTTDDDGVRRCDYVSDCMLDCFQGSTHDYKKESTHEQA